MADRYWVGGTDNWNATAGSKWALTSGGAGGQAVPTSSDDVFFDAASGAITATIPSFVTNNCNNLDFTGFTGSFVGVGNSVLNVSGSLKLVAGMSYTNPLTLNFVSTSSGKTITSAGKLIKPRFNGVGGYWTLLDNIVSGSVNITNGTFDTGNFDCTCTVAGTGGTIILGSSVMSINGSGDVWALSSSAGISAGTSTIKFIDNSSSEKRFSGNGLVYNNFYNNTAGSGQLKFIDGNTFNDFKIDAGRTQLFTAGTTTNIESLTATGSLGNLITIDSISAATHTLNFTGAVQSNDYLDIAYSIATGADTYAGANSMDSGNNTGWIFTAPAGPANLKDFNGIDKVNIQSINGIAIANIATVNGI